MQKLPDDVFYVIDGSVVVTHTESEMELRKVLAMYSDRQLKESITVIGGQVIGVTREITLDFS